MTTCSRPGCTKTLRKNNTTGMCGSGCLSPEAPPAKRAKDTGGLYPRPKAAKAAPGLSDLEKFRLLNELIGLRPDEVLNEFAHEWLELLKTKMTEG